MREFTTTIQFTGDQAKRLEHLLTYEPKSVEEAFTEWEPVISFSSVFKNGYTAHVNIFGVRYEERMGVSNLPYVEVELIDKEGSICEYFDIDNECFFGVHTFFYEGTTYELIISTV